MSLIDNHSELLNAGRSIKASHVEELDDRSKSTNEEEEIMSQEEYVTRLRELNDDIAHAWLKNERVAALRLAVKVRLVTEDIKILFFYSIAILKQIFWSRTYVNRNTDDFNELIE